MGLSGMGNGDHQCPGEGFLEEAGRRQRGHRKSQGGPGRWWIWGYGEEGEIQGAGG